MRSANSADDVTEFYDAMIVGNPDKVEAAVLQLYFTPNLSYKEEPLGDPVTLAPSESHIFELNSDVIGGFSTVRTGGVYRVVSDIPVIAYLHSPLKNSASNDSSMLLPTRREVLIVPALTGHPPSRPHRWPPERLSVAGHRLADLPG